MEFWDELPDNEQDALAELDDEDRHLVNACLEVEAWLARRNFRRVEGLLAHGMFGEREAAERLRAASAEGELGLIARDLADLMDLGLC